MMRRFGTMICILCLATAVIYAVTPEAPRLILTVGQVTISPNDTIAVVPVYLTNPLDSLAGVEFALAMPQNNRLHFATDEPRRDSLPVALDTAGTLLSGWEWVGMMSPSKTLYDVRVVGLADMPDNKRTLPAAPHKDGLLAKIVLRVDKAGRMASDTLIQIRIIPERCTFSDPRGTALGVKTTMTQKCEQYQGDSCLSWKTVRVGTMDTTVVKFKPGGVRISEAAKGKP